MISAQLNFGKISAFAASSAATYSENTMKLDHEDQFSGVSAKVVFVATSAVTGFKAAIYSDDAESPTTIVAQAPKAVTLAKGDIVELSIPKKLGKFMRAGGSASSTSATMEVSIEMGEPRP